MLTTIEKITDQKILSSSKMEGNTNTSITTMGIQNISKTTSPKQHTLFWGSSYDRGLDILLKLWPLILEKYPDATLHVCYGWDLFIKGYSNNPERMNWMQRMNEEMKQQGIIHHGRVSKKELEEIRNICGIWAYPTYFPEINCITALECQRNGVVPVVMDYAALIETVQSGVKVSGDIYDKKVQENYLKTLLELMGDEKKWVEEAKKGREFTYKISWDQVSKDWSKHFE